MNVKRTRFPNLWKQNRLLQSDMPFKINQVKSCNLYGRQQQVLQGTSHGIMANVRHPCKRVPAITFTFGLLFP